MNATVQPLPATAQKNAAGHAQITGRIEQVTRKNGKNGVYFVSLLKLPAADEFSSPGTVEVTSDVQVGVKGETVRLTVKVSGYPRSYQTKPSRDYPDGETVYTADNRLEVVA